MSLIKELMSLNEDQNVTMQAICDALEQEGIGAYSPYQVTEKSAVIFASGYQGQDCEIKLAFIDNKLHVELRGESGDGEEHERDYDLNVTNVKDLADVIDEVTDSFFHNELEPHDDDDDGDDDDDDHGYDEDED